ncbi:YggS family pyridoxal phosphate-dependent enzyme [Undibacterium squillarum]|uniref:YggS family pyridoxal phosphate-dependent enzyme n=1 Tax=Undibacterium squillarum TaxID=1131567 RepID=UPI0035B1100B
MSPISDNLQAVRAQIDCAEQHAGRAPGSVCLVAVSKTFPADAVIEAAKAGQRDFGENYLQEAQDKLLLIRNQHPELALCWHFIGPLQSNKTRPVAEHFDWVHSVDRLKIAQRLSEQRPAYLPPLNICLQINVSGESSKSGASPEEALALAQAVKDLPGLRLRGLMAVPEATEDTAAQHAAFASLRVLAEQIRSHGIALDTLSMGMSADMQAAISEGSTMVRIGTAIFGKRHYAA